MVGLLLAGGAGRRLGTAKALLRDPDGTPWVARSALVLAGGGCAPVLVVVGAAATEVAPLVPARCRVVTATDWAEGMAASLRAGLAAAETQEASALAALVALVDTPGAGVPVVRRLVARAAPQALARASYGGSPGHPVLIGRAHWAGVMATARGDRGARDYLAGHDVDLVECSDIGDGRDIDTAADLEPGRSLEPGRTLEP